MNTSYSVSYQVAQEKRRDMLAEAQRAGLARQARSTAPASQSPARHRRTRHLIGQLRPQAQS